MRRDLGGWALLALFVALVVLGGVLLGWLLARPITPGPVVLPTPTIRVATLTPAPPAVVAVPPRAGATNTPEPASLPPVLVLDPVLVTPTPIPPLVDLRPTETPTPDVTRIPAASPPVMVQKG